MLLTHSARAHSVRRMRDPRRRRRDPPLLLQAIGTTLPAALAVALSPFPVIGIVVIVSGPRGRRTGPLFALGWVAGLAIVAALVVTVLGGADDADSTSSAIADWGRVLAGAALIVLGVRKWASRPRGDEEATVPGWMASLDAAGAGKALGLGALLSANPKNIVLSAAAATSIVEAGAHGNDLVVSVAVFVVVASVSVIGVVVLRLVGGAWGTAQLDALRRFMAQNSVVITVVVLLLLGAKILGDGLIGLGR